MTPKQIDLLLKAITVTEHWLDDAIMAYEFIGRDKEDLEETKEEYEEIREILSQKVGFTSVADEALLFGIRFEAMAFKEDSGGSETAGNQGNQRTTGGNAFSDDRIREI